jgi:hypothetical protein
VQTVTVSGVDWDTPHIIGGIWDWSNAELFASLDGTETERDGGFQTAGVTSATTSDRISMSEYLYPYQGYVGEFLIVQQALSDADRRRVEGYLAHRFALTASLPSGHPYKSNPPTYIA